MLGLAAAQLGYKVHIYAPDAESVAAEVTAHHSQAAWDDEPRLAAFAAACDVVTYEFENVRSEEHTSELQSLMRISYAVFCLKKKNILNSYILQLHTLTIILYILQS